MCWVAMDRAAKLAEIRGDKELAASWGATADEIKADILEHGVDERGVLRQHYETDALDASTLLAAIFGFLPGDDERLRASVLAIADELTEHGFVLRYKTGETDDGLSGKEGTFLICSFWLVSALAVIGELQRARDLMERLLREASPLGPLRRGVRRRHQPAPRELPAGVLPPGPDRGRCADHPRGAAGGVDLMSDYDVIVIGSGAGGGTLVRRLAPSGKRILLLERGDWLPREPANWDARSVFVENRYVSRGHLVRRATARPSSRRSTTASGGATKLYGAALYRLRAEDFGELRTTTASLPPGRSATTRWSRTTRSPSSSTRSTARAARTRPSRRASAPYPFPAVSHEPRIQQLSDDLAAAGHHPFHAPCGVMLDEANMPFGRCVRCATCDGFPCLVHAKSDAEVLAVRPALEHPNVTLVTNAEAVRLETNAARHGRHRRGRRARRRARDLRGRHRRRLLRRGEQRQAAARVGERRPSQRARQRLRPGRAQLHVPQQPGGAGALEGAEPHGLPEDARAQRLLLRRRRRRVPARQHPDGRQVVGGDVPRREAARRRSSRRSARSSEVARHAVDFWLSTEDLPRPENRVTLRPDGSIALAYTPTNDDAQEAAATTSSSRCSAHLGMHPDHLLPRHAYLKNDIPVAGVAHQAGTCRFGADPATSVLDTRLPRARGRQPLRRRHELLPEHRRREPGADRDGERAARGRPPRSSGIGARPARREPAHAA